MDVSVRPGTVGGKAATLLGGDTARCVPSAPRLLDLRPIVLARVYAGITTELRRNACFVRGREIVWGRTGVTILVLAGKTDRRESVRCRERSLGVKKEGA